jgi:hypothetical protein
LAGNRFCIGLKMIGAAKMAIRGGSTPSYLISKSVRFNSADSAYMNRTPGVAGNQKKFTISLWCKRSSLGTSQTFIGSCNSIGSQYFFLFFDTSDRIALYDVVTYNAGSSMVTSAVYRDIAAWLHITIAVDTDQATAADRVKLYVNGQQVTAFSAVMYPPQGTSLHYNYTIEHGVGRDAYTGGYWYFNGYIADVYSIDGQQLTPSSFAMTNPTTGQWVPKAYSGTYGTNGCHLAFESGSTAAALGTDTSGNGNTWTVNNISVAAGVGNDWLADSPTNNYCILSVLDGGSTLSNGGLNYVTSIAGNCTCGTFFVSSGKWYWEYAGTVGGNWHISGIATTSRVGSTEFYYVAYYGNDGQKYINGINSAYGATYTNNDIIGVALDMTAGTVTFYKNGTSQGAITIGNAGPFAPCIGDGNGSASTTGWINFGQRAFSYTPPTGFLSLCTTNLPTPTILLPNQYMNTKLYTGTGASLALTGVGHQPDLVWIKSRSAATDNTLYDSTRGVQAHLSSNDTNAETTTDAGLTAFGSDGFTVNTLAQVNTSSATYAAWCFKKGATPGFDILTFTAPASGTTAVNHSLGVAPDMVVVKTRNTANGWWLWHRSLGDNLTDYLNLGTNVAEATFSTMWGTVGRTSTQVGFTVGGSILANATEVSYVFAGVPGFSSFGKYTGNGAADGPFVWCGFRPRWIMIKRFDASANWIIIDTARNVYNVTQNVLDANTANTESAYLDTGWNDILSNGFKVRYAGVGVVHINTNGGTYLYAAFAEAPFKNANAR